jgi:hypothetical protein
MTPISEFDKHPIQRQKLYVRNSEKNFRLR